ncbi:MAG TPA: hypothetical protein DDY91_21795 [Planctomycetaceae bacterium]|nr:hypothetical protein [Planctomycetaceae bacterium]
MQTEREDADASQEIRAWQRAIDESILRRAARLTMAQKLLMGASLYDEQIRWLIQILKAEHPEWTDVEVRAEIARRKAIQRQVEEAGLFRVITEDEERASLER